MSTTHVGPFVRQLARGLAAEAYVRESDRQLVERLLVRADEAVFEALVRRHGAMVYRVCWRILQQTEDTEDAFQATFLLLAQKLTSLRKHASLASWLHGIAHRVALDARKRAARRRRCESRVHGPLLVPPDDASWREVRTVLDAELAALPEPQRLPLILCYLEGRTQDEAAHQLGWSKSTLLRRLAAGRTALGRRLTRRGFAWSAAGLAVLLTDVATPASPPRELVRSAVDAALAALTDRMAVGAISANVLVLTEGALKTMSHAKRKIAVALLLVALVTAGAGLGGLSHLGAQPQPPQANQKDTILNATPNARPADPKPIQEGPNHLLIAWADRLALVDATGKEEKSLLRVQTSMDSVRISPDGKRVAFIAVDPKAVEPKHVLHVAGVDDQEGQSLGISPRSFAWSPDGTEIAYTEFTSDKKLTATHGIVNVQTGAKSELSLPDDHYVTDWSRDGKWFLTTRIWPRAGVFMPDRERTSMAAVTEDKLPVGSYGLGGRLSPDGRQVLFQIVTPSKERGKQATSQLALHARGKVTPVADVPANGQVLSYCWSPDGKRIAYVWSDVFADKPKDQADREIESRLVTCDPDGKNAQVIAAEKGRLVMIPGIDWR